MNEEARLDNKIKELQDRKKQLHAKQRDELYRTVGKYFLGQNGQYALNESNYKEFMLISQQDWDRLHIAANHMYHDVSGQWRLQPGNQDELTQWLAQNFRDDYHQNGSSSQREEEGKVPLGEGLYTFPELSDKYGVNARTIDARYRRGDRGKDLVRPVDKIHQKYGQPFYMSGRPFTLDKLSRLYHLSPKTIRNRYYQGKRDYELIRPIQSNHKPDDSEHHITPHERLARKRIRFQGKLCTLQELGQKYGLKVTTLSGRYYQGKKGKDLVAPSQRHHVTLRVDGKDYNLSELSRASGVPYQTLSNRYYNYHLRGDDIIHPGLLNAKFDIGGKTYTLPKLGRRYHVKTTQILKTIQARYRQGKRGNELIRPFEEEEGAIQFQGHHYTPEELGRRYHLSTQVIINRYYNKKERGKDLVQPQDNPNQMSLTESTLPTKRPNNASKDVPSSRTDNTQAAYRELTDQKVTLHGNVVGQPQYEKTKGNHAFASFIVIAKNKSSSAQQMFPGGFVSCVAKDDEAKAIHHKVINYNRVTVTGQIKASYYRGHPQNEIIVRDIKKDYAQ